jgi:hypothetical protein
MMTGPSRRSVFRNTGAEKRSGFMPDRVECGAFSNANRWHHGSINRHVIIAAGAVVVFGLLPSPADPATKPLTRAQYAAVLRQRVDPPVQILYDTFYLFTSDGRSLQWATAQTVKAQLGARAAVRRLAVLTPPRRVADQHVRIVKALRRLDEDLQVPINASRQGRKPVLQWWLQKYGALPELFALKGLHATLSRIGYWK